MSDSRWRNRGQERASLGVTPAKALRALLEPRRVRKWRAVKRSWGSRAFRARASQTSSVGSSNSRGSREGVPGAPTRWRERSSRALSWGVRRALSWGVRGGTLRFHSARTASEGENPLLSGSEEKRKEPRNKRRKRKGSLVIEYLIPLLSPGERGWRERGHSGRGRRGWAPSS